MLSSVGAACAADCQTNLASFIKASVAQIIEGDEEDKLVRLMRAIDNQRQEVHIICCV
jgi:spore coat polysaccharide biosynthesis protein SpsF (cytidylyltransferase family)